MIRVNYKKNINAESKFIKSAAKKQQSKAMKRAIKRSFSLALAGILLTVGTVWTDAGVVNARADEIALPRVATDSNASQDPNTMEIVRGNASAAGSLDPNNGPNTGDLQGTEETLGERALPQMETSIDEESLSDAEAALLDPSISQEILRRFGEAPYDVLIRMEDVQEGLEAEDQARLSQNDLTARLEEGLLHDEVESFESFYVVNAMHAVIRSEHLMAELLERSDISYITPNFKVMPAPPITSDTSMRSTTMFRRSVDLAALTGNDWGSRMIQADRVWEEYGIYGEGTVVGIIDTGVNYKLPQLRDSFRGYDASNGTYHAGSYIDTLVNKSEPDATSVNDHGTMVAGIISGKMQYSNESFGIAPKTKFISARALDPQGTSMGIILQSAQWMLEQKPDVVNASWGYDDIDSNGIFTPNPWFEEIARQWREAGIVAVFASGNTSGMNVLAQDGSILNPASLTNVLAVGAIDSQQKLGYFSKRGPSHYDPTGTHIKPDLVAPGINVYSIRSNGVSLNTSGTSYAAPFVTATVALMRSANPNLTVDEIEDILKSTATPLTDAQYTQSPNMGYGYGVVNAYAAVTKVRELAGISSHAQTNPAPDASESNGHDVQERNPIETGNHTDGSSAVVGNNTANASNTSVSDSLTNTNAASGTGTNTGTTPSSNETTNADHAGASHETHTDHANGSGGAANSTVANSANTTNTGATNPNTISTNTTNTSTTNASATNTTVREHTAAVSSTTNHTKTTVSSETTAGTQVSSTSSKQGSELLTHANSDSSDRAVVTKASASSKVSSSGGSGGGGGGGSVKAANSAKNTSVETRTWKQDSKGWRLENKDGTYPKSNWTLHGQKWYYFDDAGYAVVGWKQVGGHWYYMNADCAMVTGWVQVGSHWYYLGSDGAMYANTVTPDGYRVGADGAWKK